MPTQGMPKVLLADSSPRMRRILRVNLEGAGCAVTETSGEGLDRLVREASFAALVLNLDGRGPGVCDAVNVLRRRNEGAVIAGYSILPVDERIRQMCIDMYVETPFDVARLANEVRRACERAFLLASEPLVQPLPS